MIDISIIIVSFNTKKLLENCLLSIKMHAKGINYEVIVVDNASSESITGITSTTGLKIIQNKKNLGFAKANNQGIKKAQGRYVLLLNSDTELVENSLMKMIKWMDKHQEVGIVSCKLVNADGSTQPTGGSFPTLWRVFLWASFLDDLPGVASIFGSYHPHTGQFFDEEHQQDWVIGAFMLIRREVVDNIGYLDEDFFMYGEDVEYCLRTREAGWEVWYTPLTQIVHLGSKLTERTVIGEFSSLPKIYKKHFAFWQYPFLLLFLKLGAFLRMIFFAIRGEGETVKVYAKAFSIN